MADAYDVMSSDRIYRKAIPREIIRQEIISGAGTQFDPDIAEVMLSLIDLDAGCYAKEQE